MATDYLQQWFVLNKKRIQIIQELQDAILQVPGSHLELNEYYLLYFLDEAPDKKLKQIDLTDKLNLSNSATSRMIARLESKKCGVISRQPCELDKRATYIALTTKGKELLDRVNAVTDELLSQHDDVLG